MSGKCLFSAGGESGQLHVKTFFFKVEIIAELGLSLNMQSIEASHRTEVTLNLTVPMIRIYAAPCYGRFLGNRQVVFQRMR